ncbi:hypothetical protein PTTG_30316 [Puccinia triticina 1-1 BBBD Race 1]|uniref:Uncharacterized protein n=1 Tax=Puccinia triticina (isolate 1-1 / race 1 (BBBD)) TaxID=630390 RepID=A0A180FZ78_PUCT1|nr:hypothetical protein PTTG_30316 [Puccinia triticina 1-1 BBBD Race 1]
MKMYEAVIANQQPKLNKVAVDNEVQVKFTTPTIPQKRPLPIVESTQVRNVKFIVGRSNSHDDGGFTPYFHKLLLECKGPLPLTIFNREWQEQALSYHSKNRPKTEETAAEKGLRYHGYPVPDEFSQNFSDWTLNHRGFYLTMRDQYNYPVLAEWILAHKEHCNRLHRTQGFMVALRYDIRIRNNAFAFRVEEDGEESFSDISKFKQDTADEAISICRDFNEIGLQDNPYALGDGKVGGDPIKGIRPPKAKQANHQPQPPQPKTKTSHKENADEPLAHTHRLSSLPAKPEQNRGPRGSGYKGNNFNPNHTGGSVRNRNRDQ